MPNVYIVMGSTCEYSDHYEWPVLAFRSEEAAEEHVLKASARFRELLQEAKGVCWDVRKDANEFDPEMQVDYPGTNYYVITVELKE